MKVISIWQPYASLIVHGFKTIETRGWAAPKSLLKERIGIAATKSITPAQVTAVQDPTFKRYYAETGLPGLLDLPRGALLGTVLLNSCDPITEADLEDITEEEQCYGWFTPGRFAWRLRYPLIYERPVPVRGQQGIWDYQDGRSVVPFRSP